MSEPLDAELLILTFTRTARPEMHDIREMMLRLGVTVVTPTPAILDAKRVRLAIDAAKGSLAWKRSGWDNEYWQGATDALNVIEHELGLNKEAK